MAGACDWWIDLITDEPGLSISLGRGGITSRRTTTSRTVKRVRAASRDEAIAMATAAWEAEHEGHSVVHCHRASRLLWFDLTYKVGRKHTTVAVQVNEHELEATKDPRRFLHGKALIHGKGYAALRGKRPVMVRYAVSDVQ